MAFFAVMLPEAFTTGRAELETDILKTFKGMSDPTAVRAKRDSMVKLGQIVRDSILSRASGVTPVAPGTPAPLAAQRIVSYASEDEIRTKWESIKEERRKRRPTPTVADETSADDQFNTYLDGIAPNIGTTPKSTIDKYLNTTLKRLLRGGSGHKTPRRISRRHSYKQKVRH